MTRILLIPVTGTVAALLAILLAHGPRGETLAPPELPPFDFQEPPEHAEPPDEPEPTPPPAPEPREIHLELEKSGALVDPDSGDKYASAKELEEQLGKVRHTLFVANGDGVSEAALDEVLANLRDQFDVRKVYRAPEAPPSEGR